MLAFTCGNCGQLLFFENSVCLRCSEPIGFMPSQLRLANLNQARGDEGPRRCANATIAACNWMVEPGESGELCGSCRLTRTRPADSDTKAMAAFALAEGAKRRLLFELLDLNLPVQEERLRFDLLSSTVETVTTGHNDGLITIDLAESDAAEREQRRAELSEPYRTVLGHLRHEIAHYFWPLLVERQGEDELARWRARFGDERLDYGEALKRHYDSGAPEDWEDAYVSAYATMHPSEDWAETFAHYLHIRDTLQTAGAFGLVVAGPAASSDPALIAVPEVEAGEEPIEALIDSWLPLTYALNAVNRSMGREDLYPFTLAPKVIEKLGYVHVLVQAAGRRG
jgi:hypothetical protein